MSIYLFNIHYRNAFTVACIIIVKDTYTKKHDVKVP